MDYLDEVGGMADESSKPGKVLIVIGGLILFLSGGCTLFFVGFDLTASEQMGIWPVALMFGTLPILIGAGLLYWGLRRRGDVGRS